MNDGIYTLLQAREVFHLEFLRWFGRKLEGNDYALKGGVNILAITSIVFITY